MRRLEIKNFRGVDYSKDVTQLDANQAAEMVNMELVNGSVETFKGWKCLYPMSNIPAGGEGIENDVNFISYNSNANKIVFQRKSTPFTYTIYSLPLYSDENNNIPDNIGATLEKINITYNMVGYQYFMSEASFKRWDGVSSSIENIIDITSYIPTLSNGNSPAGGDGTEYEERNLISRRVKLSYSSDGVATLYNLKHSISMHTIDKVSVTVGVSALTEDTHFTVNRANGTIDFATGATPWGAPASGTDNVKITFYDTETTQSYDDKRDRILGCTKSILYGYGNDSRIFLYGNPKYPNIIFWSGAYEPTYYPENNYNQIGDKSSSIMGVAKQLDSLVIIKQSNDNDSTIWLMKQNYNENGLAVFDVTQGCNGIGMDKIETQQSIEDKPTFLSRNGVYRINSTNVKDERVFEHISSAIDKLLLQGINNNSYLSFDYDNKYGIIKGKKVYVFDYNSKYLKNNVIHYECCEWELPYNVTATAVIKGELYLGCDNGMIYIVKTDDSTHKHYWTEYSWVDGVYTETNNPVNAQCELPLLNYDNDNKFKHIHKINVNTSTKTLDGLFSLYGNAQKANSLDADKAIAVNQGWTTPSDTGEYTVKNWIVDVNERDVLKHQLSFRTSKDIAIMSITIDFSYGREYKGW